MSIALEFFMTSSGQVRVWAPYEFVGDQIRPLSQERRSAQFTCPEC